MTASNSIVYMVGAGAALWVIVSQLPGGVDQLVEYGRQQGKSVAGFRPSSDERLDDVLAGLVGGMFLTTATHAQTN